MFLELTSLGHLPRGSASASLLPKAAVTPFVVFLLLSQAEVDWSFFVNQRVFK